MITHRLQLSVPAQCNGLACSSTDRPVLVFLTCITLLGADGTVEVVRALHGGEADSGDCAARKDAQDGGHREVSQLTQHGATGEVLCSPTLQ